MLASNWWLPIRQQLDPILDRFENSLAQDPYVLGGCACTASFLLGFRLGESANRWKRLTQMANVPSAYVGAEAPWLRGRVVSVSDGDTVRFYHVPTRLFHSSTLDGKQKLSDVALPIRVCIIDTPETAKFGKEGHGGRSNAVQ